MEAVNSLVVAAQDKLNAACQIIALELEPAEVDTVGRRRRPDPALSGTADSDCKHEDGLPRRR